MKGRSNELWRRFKRSLSPLERKIDFWLFQRPPDYKCNQENLNAIRNFLERTNLKNNAVVEFRDSSWWRKIKQIESIGVVFCSVDAPDLSHNLIVTNGALYLRLHGSLKWYSSEYTQRNSWITDYNISRSSTQVRRQYFLIMTTACLGMDFIC
jgi:uncharacterized protein YecE (DUF72 family)